MQKAGWELKYGEITNTNASPDELWRVFNRFFSNSKKTTTYKFALMRAILENLYNIEKDFEIPFDYLSVSFSRLYWNLVIKRGYNQGKNAAINSILCDVRDSHNIPNDISFDTLNENIKLKVIQKINKKIINRYVLGAMYVDTEGHVFQFDLANSYFQLNEPAYHFMLKFQDILYRSNNYELIKFIQLNNPDISNNILIEDIENITKRESLYKYRELLIDYSEYKCFYTEKPFNRGKFKSISVDHFIPWSFIHSDNLWNFVLTTTNLNSRKGSRLPSSHLLDKLLRRNDMLLKVSDKRIQNEMRSYSESKLLKIHSYAIVNGLTADWKP